VSDGGGESAIVLVVPAVARWRLRYDASAPLGVPAHVTLLYPWRPAPVGEADLDALRRSLAGARAFDLAFRDFGRFPRVLYLRPDDDTAVRGLMRRLFAAFPEHPPYGGAHGSDAVPHLTVADAAQAGALDFTAIAAAIEADVRPRLPVATHVDAVTVIARPDGGPWSVRARLPLAP
jgi:2'-5' RNA ligase